MNRLLPIGVARAWREAFPDPLFVPTLKLAITALVHAPREPFAVVTTGPPHIVHLVGLLLKRITGCTWIADYRDLWMDDPVQAWKGGYQAALGRRAERAVLRGADAIVTVSPTWADLLRQKGDGRSVALIRNAADALGGILPPPERPWSDRERVLLFAGTPQRNNMGEEHWDGIRRYLRTAPADAPRVRFTFLGLSPDVHRRLTDLGISEYIEDLGPQPLDRATALLRGADGALIPIKTTGGPVSKGTIPAKLYQAMALRKRVVLLADPEGDAAKLVAGYPHDFAPGDDPDQMAAAISRFAFAAPATGAPTIPSEIANWSRRSAAIALDELLQEMNSGWNPVRPS